MAFLKRLGADPDCGTPDWVEVVRVGRGEWRVSDSRLARSDPGWLLGYVEKLSRHRFEVVWMTEPMRWGFADDFVAAVGGIAQRREFAGTTSAEREKSVQRWSLRLIPRARRRRSVTQTVEESVA